jgi:two-component system, OmpR family, sensor kinase
MSDPVPEHASSNAESDRSLRSLAHELNSLLDGSLRTLRLTRRAMAIGEPTPETASTLQDLDAVEGAMLKMAQALRRVLASPSELCGQRIGRAFHQERPLRESVNDVTRCLSGLAIERGVSIRFECDPAAAQLPTGPLEPVLRNAIRNAIEAFPATAGAPEVTVSLRRRGDRLLIDVLDNGPGLSEPIEASAPGQRPSKTGHGLGLHVVREIVVDLGGSFELTNVPFGPGALLRVDVPVSQLVSQLVSQSDSKPAAPLASSPEALMGPSASARAA